ncbi:hypothetical protein [Streptomyces sp. MH60]|uniref:hypothetical protein n=1 Tax=Streptomyces sp. MH60 TaxID=1940758 RepID=UPI000CEE9290|nr:hypothetical protein [Streptomyces sp. MH60]PPS89566.1 hypothetical protein BZZ08_01713 [Streptomyces sp. MH60]
MGRINVYRYDEIEGRQYAGHFDDTSAEKFLNAADNDMWEDTRLHEELYRTKGGRWVRCDWDQWQGSVAKYWFVTPDEARQWLLTEKHHDVVEKYFDELEEEAGPAVGGRPAIGPKRKVNLSEQTLARVAAYREQNSKGDKLMTEAEALRLLIEAGLDLWEKSA